MVTKHFKVMEWVHFSLMVSAVINGLRKLRHPPSWLVIFLVVP